MHVWWSHIYFKQIRVTADATNLSLDEVKSSIWDGNGNNQDFFVFDTEPQPPWLTKGGL